LVFSSKNNHQAVVPETNTPATVIQADSGTKALQKICDYFPKELIEGVINKPIVRTEQDLPGMGDACYYYTSYSETYDHPSNDDKPGGPHIIVVSEYESAENFAILKEHNEKYGTRYESDSSIGMANYVMRNSENEVWQVALIWDDDYYLKIRVIDDAVPGEDLIKIARVLAGKLLGDKSFNFEVEESQQAVVTDFFDNLFNQKIQEALTLMDADEDTKQAWGVNFNTIESLKVNQIEEVDKEEWTPTHQRFKVELEAKVNPVGEEMGWQNGTNYRWITLENRLMVNG